MMGARRVVITGLGCICPVGNCMPETWAALLQGRSGIARITLFDPTPLAVRIAGEVKGFDPAARLTAKRARHLDRYVQLAVTAAQEAIDDAGLVIAGAAAERVGVLIGTAAGGVETMRREQQALERQGPRRVNPFVLPTFLCDGASGYVAGMTGATGPSMAIVSSCATGAHALGEAMHMIKRGDADAMIAGGADTPVLPVTLAGFHNMRILAENNAEPARASRPFDRHRDGFVVAEGAAILILEERGRALARHARIYAEVSGYGAANEATHMFAQRPGGEGVARAMRRALAGADLDPDAVDYINAHGTGTPLNDRVETAAIRQVFGGHAPRLAVSAAKSMTGHMFGASGALEAAVCALAITHGFIPPTINLETPDPDCDLDYVPGHARRTRVRSALSVSIGIGGHIAALVLTAP
jgi:beta-ketoacyl-acyl-carrier-protein synthase II